MRWRQKSGSSTRGGEENGGGRLLAGMQRRRRQAGEQGEQRRQLGQRAAGDDAEQGVEQEGLRVLRGAIGGGDLPVRVEQGAEAGDGVGRRFGEAGGGAQQHGGGAGVVEQPGAAGGEQRLVGRLLLLRPGEGE